VRSCSQTSLDTTRKAFALLRDEGLIVTEHGRGSYTLTDDERGERAAWARERLAEGMPEPDVARSLGVSAYGLHRMLTEK
jgi:DNA-binding GntR family transcriptional regulator